LKNKVRLLQRERVQNLQQLQYLSRVVRDISHSKGQEPKESDEQFKKKMVRVGAWPREFQDVKKMPFGELGSRLTDYYTGCLAMVKEEDE